MKKLMLSLCALCLVGAASAQGVKFPESRRAQVQESQTAIFKAQTLDMQVEESMPARKAVAGLDSVYIQSAYGGGRYLFGLTWFQMDGQNLFESGTCGEESISWVYGTGGLPSMAGTGEIGYHFATGPGTWYSVEGHFPNLGVPYAVATDIYRSPSKGLLHEDGTYDSMPLYFKLYNSTKVGEQEVIAATTTYGPSGYVNVVYPTDPEQYTAISETVLVPAGCDPFVSETDPSASWDYPLLTKRVIAEFKDVDASRPLGNDFCVSIMLPIEWDEEGDTVIDAMWNAFPAILAVRAGEDLKFIVSEEPHCVYVVHDFERTRYTFNNDAEDRPESRPEGVVSKESMQPNTRYAVVPLDSWYWQDGSNANGEPSLKLFFTEWVALQSANKADRYVQVSPVPAVDYVNFTSYANMSRIEIYSLGGKLVKAVNVSGDTYRMNLSGMTSGMYVARIYSEKGISSKKLIVR